MKFIWLGTGSAFTMHNFQTNTIIEQNGKRLLIDIGTDIRFSMQSVGLTYKDIDALYVTHLHADHSGGMEWLAFCTYFDPTLNGKKVTLYGNGELLRKGWNNTWKGGLDSHQGKILSLNDYFDVNMIPPNGSFEWEGIHVDIVQSVHIMNGYAIVPTYGLMIKDPDTRKTIYYTGDTQFNPNQIMDFYKKADLIIQDCETYSFKSGVHANYTELITLPDEIKNKMILTHYADNVLNHEVGYDFISDEWNDKIKKDGFIEFANQGETLEVKK